LEALIVFPVLLSVFDGFFSKAYAIKNKSDNSYGFLSVKSIAGALLCLALIFIIQKPFNLSAGPFAFAVAGGAALVMTQILVMKAFKDIDVSIVMIFLSGAAILPSLMGPLIFDESINLVKAVGLVLFMVSLYLITVCGKKSETPITFKHVLLLIVTVISNGSIMIIQKIPSKFFPKINMISFAFIMFSTAAVVFALVYICLYRKFAEKNQIKSTCTFGVLSGLCVSGNNLLSIILSVSISAVFMFPVVSIGVIFINLIVGKIVFHERLSTLKIIGAVIAVIAILCLSGIGI